MASKIIVYIIKTLCLVLYHMALAQYNNRVAYDVNFINHAVNACILYSIKPLLVYSDVFGIWRCFFFFLSHCRVQRLGRTLQSKTFISVQRTMKLTTRPHNAHRYTVHTRSPVIGRDFRLKSKLFTGDTQLTDMRTVEYNIAWINDGLAAPILR